MKSVFLFFASCCVLYIILLYKRQHNKFVIDSQCFYIISEISDFTNVWTCVSNRERSTYTLRLTLRPTDYPTKVHCVGFSGKLNFTSPGQYIPLFNDT
jgi:hypothetical protein